METLFTLLYVIGCDMGGCMTLQTRCIETKVFLFGTRGIPHSYPLLSSSPLIKICFLLVPKSQDGRAVRAKLLAPKLHLHKPVADVTESWSFAENHRKPHLKNNVNSLRRKWDVCKKNCEIEQFP